MDRKHAENLFQEANRLFKQGHYADSLQILLELDRRYPDKFNLLFPLLLCREKMGCKQEALDLAGDMLARFPAPRHQVRICDVLRRLNAPDTEKSPMTTDLEWNDGSLSARIRESVRDSLDAVSWKRIAMGIGIVLFTLLLILLIPLVAYFIREGQQPAARLLAYVVGIAIEYSVSCLIGWMFLWIFDKFLYEDFVMNFLDIMISIAIFSALCLIPFIGFIFASIRFKSHYDLDYLEMLIWITLFSTAHMPFILFFFPGMISFPG